jgi:transmembrane sensor
MTDKAGDISLLIKKHIHNKLSEDEWSRLKTWRNESLENEKVFNELINEESLLQALKEIYQFEEDRVRDQGGNVVDMHTEKTNWLKNTIAAALIVGLICMVWMFAVSDRKDKKVIVDTRPEQAIQDFAPGGNKAILTLDNGKTIILDNQQNGIIAEQGQAIINKKQDGELVYSNERNLNKDNDVVKYNIVTTPRGGQYQLALPDGSKVWLNAASSLKFPVRFSGAKRVVQLSGEGYFEVAHSTVFGNRVPFEVQVDNGMKVEVMGTHFNVMAYEEEKESKTTLIEGKVKVIMGGAVYLQPGQQALLSDAAGNLRVKRDANVEEAIAWKNGRFKFERTELSAVMRNLARWYNVEFEIDKKVPKKFFTGELSRQLKASEALSIVEFAGIHTKIEGKKIIVMP